MAKAGLGILGAGIRVLTMLYHYLTPRRHGRRTGCIPWLLRTLIVCACAGVFAGKEPNTTMHVFGNFASLQLILFNILAERAERIAII
jgi:hypothetical protein